MNWIAIACYAMNTPVIFSEMLGAALTKAAEAAIASKAERTVKENILNKSSGIIGYPGAFYRTRK